MIKVNYLIEREDNGKIRTFLPFCKELDNLSLIEAPNSSGKSTLLHMIASSFYGNKNPRITDSLREKMKCLTDHQKYNFEIEIFDKNKKLILKAINNNDNSKVYEYDKKGKEQILSYDSFNRDYALIYDIPQNPIDRLKHVFDTFNQDQDKIKTGIQKLKSKVNTTLRLIKDQKNPEKITEKKKEQSETKQKIENFVKDKEEVKKKLSSLGRYIGAKFFDETREVLSKIKSQIKEEQNKLNDINKSINKKNNLSSSFSKKIEKIKSLHNEIFQGMDNLKYKDFKLWNVISFNRIYELKTFDKDLSKIGEEFKKYLHDEIVKIPKQETTKYEFFEKLIEIIKQYESDNIEIPNINTNIYDFIKILETEKDKSKTNSRRYSYLRELRNKVEDLLTEVSNFNFKEIENIDNVDITEIKYESELRSYISSLETEKERIQKKLQYYDNLDKEYSYLKLSQIPKDDFEVYSYLKEEELTLEYNKLEDKKKDLNDKINKSNSYIAILDEEIKKLEDIEEHPLFNKFDQLKKLNNETLESLNLLFVNDYSDYITSISKKENPKKSEQKIFNKLLFNLLAKQVDIIYHIDKLYHTKEIDLIENTILTEEGDLIRLSHMGTGQSQSAYLNSILNSVSNKKLLILFDEISMMDKKSISLIFEKMNDLYNKEKLLLGFVVKSIDGKIKIQTIGDIIGKNN
ncbi:MAG: hypothetical protein WC393_02095 [Candidatus Nanoarchaeia archaeon]|jgi:exonuclease SbcC